jgi:hypothetical protein
MLPFSGCAAPAELPNRICHHLSSACVRGWEPAARAPPDVARPADARAVSCDPARALRCLRRVRVRRRVLPTEPHRGRRLVLEFAPVAEREQIPND